MNEKQESQAEKPQFQKLLAQFAIESNGALELSNRIRQLTGVLMPLPESDPAPYEVMKIESGVISCLWDELYKVKRANRELEEIMIHLQNLVGYSNP